MWILKTVLLVIWKCLPESLLTQVWTWKQQCQHVLGAGHKGRISGPSPDPLSQNLYPNKIPRWPAAYWSLRSTAGGDTSRILSESGEGVACIPHIGPWRCLYTPTRENRVAISQYKFWKRKSKVQESTFPKFLDSQTLWRLKKFAFWGHTGNTCCPAPLPFHLGMTAPRGWLCGQASPGWPRWLPLGVTIFHHMSWSILISFKTQSISSKLNVYSEVSAWEWGWGSK